MWKSCSVSLGPAARRHPSRSLASAGQQGLCKGARLGEIHLARMRLFERGHHLADVLPEVDRVILLREGRVYADGPKRALLTTQRLSELFGLPVEVAQRDGYYHLW